MKVLKTIILIFITQLLSLSMFAQAPDLINYQAVARNSSGNPIQSQTISIRISILQGSATGSTVYQETHNPATDNNGAFNLQIGGGTVQSGTFSGINWGSFSHYLRIEMDVAGGTNYSVMGTTQMVSVPYAKYAETAGSVGTGSVLMDELDGAMFKEAAGGANCSQSDCNGYLPLNGFSQYVLSKSKVTSNKLNCHAGTGYEFIVSNNSITDVIDTNTSGGYTFNSATISTDYNTININYTYVDSFGTCVCTATLERQ